MKQSFSFITILMVVLVSGAFSSCSDDDDNNSTNIDMNYNYVYHHMEGRYEGTFEDVYDNSGKTCSGFVEITKVTNSNSLYKIMAIGEDGIAIAGEYNIMEYNPDYDDDGEYGRSFAAIEFFDYSFHHKKDYETDILYWHLDSGFMRLRDMELNLMFKRYVLGEHNSNDAHWCYQFVGKKDKW